ncbi:MAG: DUF4143 domain-containing protein [Oceanipulchritudo sp.]
MVGGSNPSGPIVLNQLCAHGRRGDLRYWRDKQKREVDFVLLRRGKPLLAIETKWKADGVDHKNLLAFHANYPDSELAVVSADVDRTFRMKAKGVLVSYFNLQEFVSNLAGVPRA